jgi:SAM-dependent methyltransferase
LPTCRAQQARGPHHRGGVRAARGDQVRPDRPAPTPIASESAHASMSLLYRVAYWIGVKPWEDMATLPINAQIAALFEREERERQAPYGAALDLGCGSGIWAVKLAARGWQVTGIDIVPTALRAARRRIAAAGVDARLVQGDLTALRRAGVGSGFDFVLDLGAIHGLTDAQRAAAGREVGAVAAPGATMLLLAWIPGRRGPLPRGMSRDEVGAVFPEWTVTDDVVADVSGAPGFIRKAAPRFYRLRRR